MAYHLPADPTCPVCDWLDTDARYLVVSNADAAAIVTPRPRVAGAVVVFPRAHVVTPSQLEPPAMAALWELVYLATTAIERAYNPDGMHTWEDIGTRADASFAHLTIDIVPRFAEDGYRFVPYAQLPELDEATRLRLVELLAAALP